jgi:hypothetical protein
MRFFKSLRSVSNTPNDRQLTEGDTTANYGDVSYTIKRRVSQFQHTKGMVLILKEIRDVQIYFFDGVEKVTWRYADHDFSTDRVGNTFLVGPPLKFSLTRNPDSVLPSVLERDFREAEIAVQPLWHLDPNARDYEIQKALHGHDMGIRMSFNRLPRN